MHDYLPVFKKDLYLIIWREMHLAPRKSSDYYFGILNTRFNYLLDGRLPARQKGYFSIELHCKCFPKLIYLYYEKGVTQFEFKNETYTNLKLYIVSYEDTQKVKEWIKHH